ncbi:ABC transporter ATP-binding protein [Falcatimonas sp. MSJ-15]|uniref:ABC transporter ATP-binding protein n=1 Tax=Falcatimonas sp. MSJ-15 TaxID=2841515 RepID=UPI0020A09AF4|nr:ABC transporter ATP-binding protein [Falcatimonas sp. MSJ-15]
MRLDVSNVTKKIKGKMILDNINLELVSGRIYGFVGENGSGKTMLFRAISGLMRLTSGQVSVDGQVLHKDISVLPGLGIIIENAGLYPELTGLDNLRQLAKINKKIDDEQIKEAIIRVGLDPDDKRTFRKYSLGMKQRIIIAQAIMEKPDILMLDEPTNALDENAVNIVRDIIDEERKRGALVLIASHNKEDIKLLCDEIYRVKDGKVIKQEGDIA